MSEQLSGQAARDLIQSQIEAHSDGVLASLRPFHPAQAVAAWHAEIRAIEEFINVLRFGLPEGLRAEVEAVTLDEGMVKALPAIRKVLTARFDSTLAQRFQLILVKTAAIRQALSAHGLAPQQASLATVGDAADYFQSRRRHFVSLLYLMPSACAGKQRLESLDTMNVLVPVVEHSCLTLTGLHQQLVLSHVFPDFALTVHSSDMHPNRDHAMLEADFLEPERASIVALQELRAADIPKPALEPVDRRKIFSAAELRNNLKLISAAYDAFELNDAEFAEIADLVAVLSRRSLDDYSVVIDRPGLDKLFAGAKRFTPEALETLFVNKAGSYAEALNGYEPFLQVGRTLISNVNLLTRFVYAFKSVHLASRRRFAIHAGFIFEDMVKRDLAELEFADTRIKRVDRKEFDVVALRDGVIFNIQCKNNWIDMSKVERDPVLYARYNRRLVSYYRRALKKETGREHLLKRELGLEEVRHFVLSRFPVMADEPEIIAYNQLRRRLARP